MIPQVRDSRRTTVSVGQLSRMLFGCGNFHPRLKPIAQEIKHVFLGINDLDLLRMRLEAGFGRPLLHQAETFTCTSRMGKRDPQDLARALTP